MIDPKSVVFYKPNGLSRFKSDLFERVAASLVKSGGRAILGDVKSLSKIAPEEIAVVGCMPETRPLIDEWLVAKRQFIYWDRGYARRVFACWLPRGENGGYYRWTRNAFQMREIRDVPAKRWNDLTTPLSPWRKNGKHIVVACPTETYSRFHNLTNWTEKTLEALARVTDRPVICRHKESKRPLQNDLDGAHALVSHGSIAAVESAILGTPVFVDESSAAALVGLTDLSRIERPVYPDREPWVRSLAHGQFNEAELVDGTLWKLLPSVASFLLAEPAWMSILCGV